MTRARLNVFFDVDFTLLSIDGSLRPGTRETFQRLIADGHRIFIWSGVGIRTTEIAEHELQHLVSDVFIKPQEDLEAGLTRFGVHTRPDFVVDDDARIVTNFGGMLVQPYYFSNTDDIEMDLIYLLVSRFAETGNPEHAAFRIGRNGKRSNNSCL
ncbi:MAG: HAD hydrolase family protein [Dehalococcoidia bacterium]